MTGYRSIRDLTTEELTDALNRARHAHSVLTTELADLDGEFSRRLRASKDGVWSPAREAMQAEVVK